MSIAATTADVSRDLATPALDLLREHRDFMDREKRTRLHLVKLARQYGLTNQQIGAALGMTEAGVRKMLERAEPPRGGAA